MRWLADEGVPKILIAWLRERGDDVFYVREAGMRGMSDKELCRLAGRQRHIVLTLDVGFLHPEVEPLPLGLLLVRAPSSWRAESILWLVQTELERVPVSVYRLHG